MSRTRWGPEAHNPPRGSEAHNPTRYTLTHTISNAVFHTFWLSDFLTFGQIVGRTDRTTEEWADGWVDEQMDRATETKPDRVATLRLKRIIMKLKIAHKWIARSRFCGCWIISSSDNWIEMTLRGLSRNQWSCGHKAWKRAVGTAV